MSERVTSARWVCLDVGETLIDETRIWSLWADELAIPRLTFMAAFGVAIERGGEHSDVFEIVGEPDWRARLPNIIRAYGGFQPSDLYPDVLPALGALRACGYRIAIIANQPAERTRELRALGVVADVMAMSAEMGVSKPHPGFFEEGLRRMGDPHPRDVVYVGDRIDNDIVPAMAAGMRSVWLRRGPWGVVQLTAPDGTHLVVDSLTELVERVDECWSDPSTRASASEDAGGAEDHHPAGPGRGSASSTPPR